MRLAVAAGLALAGCGPGRSDAYPIDTNPAADWEASPYTGWTRAHYEAVFGRLCAGFVAHRSEGGARALLPDPGGWSQIEGVSRMTFALGAWLADPHNPDVIDVDGVEIDVATLVREMLVVLSDPQSDERWPELRPGYYQANVEAAYVAQLIVQTEDRVWSRMTYEEREQVMAWLSAADAEQEYYTNNWNLFGAMRNVARLRLGYAVDVASTDAYLDRIEQEYVGDGWYGDGALHNLDWYNSFVLHPELLFWAMKEGHRDRARAERIVRRLRAYLHHLPYLFAADGRAVAFGRSLAYRTAILAPLPLALQAGVSALPPGQARRLVSGNLAYHMRGDPSSTDAMIDDDDLVTIGYLGERHDVREGYISSGSPYFATRVLQVLALPRDHEFWTAHEAPLPADQGAFEHVMPAPALTSFSAGGDEPVTLWNGGNQTSGSTYAKLAYSSHFPFQRVPVDGSTAYDAALAATPDGSTFWLRGPAFEAMVAPGLVLNRSAFEGNEAIASRAGVNVGDVLVRLGCVDPGVTSDDRGLRLFEGAHPVALDSVVLPDPEQPPTGERLDVEIVRRSGGEALWEYARSSTGSVMIAALLGYDMTIPAHAFKGHTDLNLVHEQAVQPAIATRVASQGPQCVASLQLSRAADFDPAEVRARVRDVVVDQDARTFRFGLDGGADGGGTVDVWVSLATWIEPGPLEVAGFRFEGSLRYARVERGGRRVAAAGATVIRDPDGVVVFEVEPGSGPATVSIDLDAGRITTDAPGRFGAIEPLAIAGLDVDGGWTDRTNEVGIDGEGLRVPAEVLEAHTTAQELTMGTFAVELP
jgi:hypothetical protein